MTGKARIRLMPQPPGMVDNVIHELTITCSDKGGTRTPSLHFPTLTEALLFLLTDEGASICVSEEIVLPWPGSDDPSFLFSHVVFHRDGRTVRGDVSLGSYVESRGGKLYDVGVPMPELDLTRVPSMLSLQAEYARQVWNEVDVTVDLDLGP